MSYKRLTTKGSNYYDDRKVTCAEEDLHKAQWNYKIGLSQSQANNKKLKDRIAELENEIRENAFYSKGYAQGIKNTYEVVIPDKLKQFAEKIKDLFVEDDQIREEIDETLKEFINVDK